METHTEVLDFTPQGARRFAKFMAASAPQLKPETCAREALGALENCLNTEDPLIWGLPVSKTEVRFEAEQDDLAINVEAI
ncbi:MAG: hypothetical protein LBU43_09705 [Candidatus Accumulibacter sp.]|nr:hypothetical protein [Accumulibacter sp.]